MIQTDITTVTFILYPRFNFDDNYDRYNINICVDARFGCFWQFWFRFRTLNALRSICISTIANHHSSSSFILPHSDERRGREQKVTFSRTSTYNYYKSAPSLISFANKTIKNVLKVFYSNVCRFPKMNNCDMKTSTLLKLFRTWPYESTKSLANFCHVLPAFINCGQIC